VINQAKNNRGLQMNNIREFIRKTILSDDLSVEAKSTNIIFIIGMFCAFVAMVVRIAFHDQLMLILVIFGIVISAGVLLLLCNKFHIYTIAGTIAIIVICNMLFPAAYFFLGGVESSITANFILSMILVFLLSHKKQFIVMLVLHLVLTIGCFFVEMVKPELVVRQLNAYEQFIDHIQSFVIISLCVGILISFQDWIYQSEKTRSEKAEKEIIRQDELLYVINEVAQVLLTNDTDNFEKEIKKSLQILGSCINVDRINVW
jgi:hypothetical protein